ncbi:hypothetical protein [Paenibacillus riograndensis]|uniref:Uncharacterized protein n=1 Tax=Paenibacillus riograndensis SBR5 TaxID=1073571 RepID=A0A0E3WGZ8_9BACL|nr:hypothetical protein [Paenibacillus riograndensis]CQR54413.1 hypothetical protein PRIO_2004 [Paenibacillus riograndensis SBR5]
MSYEVHITRADHWSNSAEKPITLKDAQNYFATKTDFEYRPELLQQTPFGSMAMGGDFFIWKSEGMKVPFRYQEGRITVSGADDFAIGRMKEAAHELKAIVQGDEGEIY